MNSTDTDQSPGRRKPLRVWPGVAAVAAQWLTWQLLPALVPGVALYAIVGGVLGGGAAVLLWWLFLSRASWAERVGILLLMPAGLVATSYFVHPSIGQGAMGMFLYVLAIPALGLALVGSAALGRRLAPPRRSALMAAGVAAACAAFTLVRTGGMTGAGESDFHWRWAPTPEERLLAVGGDEAGPPPAAAGPAGAPAEWPGFRGPGRDGVARGPRVATDWDGTPPAELWRRPVGPAWSSFAVRGGRFYTQEQRGGDEVVACYDLATGRPVWSHRDAARFWESTGGAGPRATPTLSDGRAYTLGATGIVNALDAATGAVVWSRNVATDADQQVPGWGFAGSPLVIDDLVIVAAAGRLIAYGRDSGEPRWLGPKGGAGYSSPHLATLDGVRQVLLLARAGVTSVDPVTGAPLWEHRWTGDGIVQPALPADGGVLLGSGSGMAGAATGVRRLDVTRSAGGWAAAERWTSAGLKPHFNDLVIHGGHAYGFDGGLLACVDLADGKRRWKDGRYGYGQLVLLADQGVLLVLSEKGGLALVAAEPSGFRELARFPAVQGKTWGHPVIVGDVVLVRNAEEMVALRMPLWGR
jgi:outer membrane protein assembly factor BamB